MKIGISTASLSTETEAALSTIAELGAEACNVALRTFYEYRPEFAQKYRDRAKGMQLSIGVRAENFEGQLFEQSRRVRGDGFYWLDQVMRSAQAFGAKDYILRGRAGASGDFDDWGAHMREITGFCARYGVSVCLENSLRGIYNRPEVFKELKQRCPELKGVLNLNQARLSGYPYTMYLRNMCGAIAEVRLSDEDINGVFDLKELFAGLKEVGFDGSVIIDSPAPVPPSTLKSSMQIINNLIVKNN